MGSRRTEKIAEAIRKIVSMAITSELRDPRVGMVTVTQVEVAGDLRQAKVHVSIMGDDTKQRLGLQGLRSAAGFLQSKIASGVDLRYTPKLEFVLDQGVKKSLEIARLLAEVLPPTPAAELPADQSELVDETAEFEDLDEADEDLDDPDATAEYEKLPSPDVDADQPNRPI